MSVRFDAAADRLLRTASNPSASADLSLCFWAYISTDRNNYSCFWYMGGDNYGSSWVYVGTDNDGTTLLVDVYGVTGAGPALSVSTWYFITVDCNWTSPADYQTSVRVYNTSGAQVGSTVNVANRPTNNTRFEFGGVGSGNNDVLNGRVAAIKLWAGTRLTSTQLRAEQFRLRPVRVSYTAFWPCYGGAAERLRDYGPSGYTFTAGGTLTDEAGPPLPTMWPWTYQPWSVAGGGGTTYNQSVSGGLTPAGAMARQISALKAGSMSSSGALARRPATAKTGSVTPAGSLTKQTRLSKAGGITPSGALSAIKTALVALSGAVAFAGALVRQIATAKTGSLTSSGALTRQTRLSKTGAVTPSGALSAIRAALLSLAGSLASSGALVRQTRPLKAGTLTSAGGLNKLVSTAKAGSLTPSGTLTKVRAVLLSLAGSLTSSGALLRQTGKSLSGSLASGGSLTRLIGKILSGALSLAGALAAQGGTLIYKALHARLRDYTLTASERDHDLTTGDRDYTLTAEDR